MFYKNKQVEQKLTFIELFKLRNVTLILLNK